MGWFGPRGLVSVVLSLVYLQEVTSIGANSSIVLAMSAAVLVSILAHGISSNPAVKLYARKIADLGSETPEYVNRLR